MYIPTVDETSKKVLAMIRRAGVASGWQLISEVPVTAEELSKAAQTLQSMSLISTQGNIVNPGDISDAYFNIQPSNIQLAEFVLNSPNPTPIA